MSATGGDGGVESFFSRSAAGGAAFSSALSCNGVEGRSSWVSMGSRVSASITAASIAGGESPMSASITAASIAGGESPMSASITAASLEGGVLLSQ